MGKILEFKEKKEYNFITGYKFLNYKGSGSFGGVYIFEDEYFKRKVAIKFYNILDMAVREKNEYESFINEAKILLRLTHPNIVRFYNVMQISGHTENKPSIIMEYIDGLTIDSYINRSPDKINDIFHQSLQAFRYLEENGICHGDISSRNVLVNDSGILKLIDFGLSKRRKEDFENVSYTIKSGIKIKRPLDKIAPEESTRKYYHVTDQFYLANLIKELVNNNLSADFHYLDIIEKMSDLEKNNRYDNFAQIISDVKKVDNNKVVEIGNQFSELEKEQYNLICDDFFRADIFVNGGVYYSYDGNTKNSRIEIVDNFFVNLVTFLEKNELRNHVTYQLFLKKIGFIGNFKIESMHYDITYLDIEVLNQLASYIISFKDLKKRKKIVNDFCERIIEFFNAEEEYELPF